MRLEVPGSELIVNIGTQKQLFIDDYIIERSRWITPRLAETARYIQPPARDRSDLDGWTEGVDQITGDVPGHLIRATSFVKRTLNQPQRFEGNPVMERAYPWEGESAPWPTSIIYDDEEGIWKMWYNGLTTEDVPVRRWHYRCLYATSKDGITWTVRRLACIRTRMATIRTSSTGERVSISSRTARPILPGGTRWSTPRAAKRGCSTRWSSIRRMGFTGRRTPGLSVTAGVMKLSG